MAHDKAIEAALQEMPESITGYQMRLAVAAFLREWEPSFRCQQLVVCWGNPLGGVAEQTAKELEQP